MSNSVACHRTDFCETMNAGEIEDMLIRLMSRANYLRDGIAYAVNVRSKKSTNALALAVAARPVGSTAHRSSGGRLHSERTARTAPDRSSGLNIHSDAMVSPASASTAALTPSAAVTRSRL